MTRIGLVAPSRRRGERRMSGTITFGISEVRRRRREGRPLVVRSRRRHLSMQVLLPVAIVALVLVQPPAVSGQVVDWTRQFGTSSFDVAYAVAVDGSGVYVAGRTDGTLPGEMSAGGDDAFLRKYGAEGTEAWA